MSFEAYKIFEKSGGKMIAPNDFQKKAKQIKALVFDWDGVFHSGRKVEDSTSTFSEIDSMGVNMLRFGYYLMHGDIPKTFILTGEENKTCFYLAKREHFDAVFYKVKFKGIFLDYVFKEHNIKPEEILFVFDDIIDLQLAEKTGLSIMVQNPASAMLLDYCKKHNIVSYYTANTGETNVVRESCELVLDAIGIYYETIEKRYKQDAQYITYLDNRNKIETLITDNIQKYS